MKTYNIRVRADTGYYKVEAESLDDATVAQQHYLLK